MHDLLARKLITEADRGGLRAKTMGTVVAIIAALASIFTFLYIIFKLRQQQIMIKQLDESEKKAREVAQIKENFMANMSHEIRTPMNAILGFTNILKRKIWMKNPSITCKRYRKVARASCISSTIFLTFQK